MSPPLRRRSLIGGSLVGTLALALPRPAASAASPASKGRGPQPYALAAWQGVVGATLPTSRGQVLLERLQERGADDGQSFQLHFRVVRGPAPSDALTVTHPDHGEVPFMTTPHGLRCVAVVNHRRA